MKDFMTVYNSVTENCFKDCINDFTSKKILKQEVCAVLSLTMMLPVCYPYDAGCDDDRNYTIDIRLELFKCLLTPAPSPAPTLMQP